ncbi:MAG: AAA family ATPase, partial [Gammaproteobacteria bacterium]
MARQAPFTTLEYTQWDALVERLHRLFMAHLDVKAFDLYIEPNVTDRDTGAEYSAFARLTAFIHDKGAASLLLAGEPGMGKTLLSLHIAQQTWYHFIKANIGGFLNVTNPYWQKMLTQLEAQGFSIKQDSQEQPTAEKETATPDNCLPVWMWMPFLATDTYWKTQLLEAYARQNRLLPHEIQLLHDTCQLNICRLCPIMDGWDELPPGEVTDNLYLSSGFWTDEGWPHIKVLSTCRPEAFIHYEKSQGNYRSIFHSPQGMGQYTILNLSPFESKHIHAYVTRYIGSLPSDYVPTLLPLFSPAEESMVDEAKEAWLKDYEKYAVNTVQRSRLSLPEEKQEQEEAPQPLAIHLTPANPQLSHETVNWHCVATYLNYLEHIHGLHELVKTPFILSAVVQVLPTIVLHEQRYHKQDISRYIIYQYFIEHWLTKQATRLWADPQKRKCLAELE